MTTAITIGSLLVGGIVLLVLGRRRAVWRRRCKLESREPVAADVWTAMSSGVDQSTVASILELFASDLEVPIDRLYPTDRFSEELQLKGLLLIDEVVVDDLIEAVRDRFGNVEWDKRWDTVSDATFGLAAQIESDIVSKQGRG